MQITQIKQQKDKNRVNIYLDGKFSFGIDLENYVKLGLRVEQELTQEQIDEITKKAEFHKTFEKILNFAMVRPRSEKEYKDWMKRKKVSETIHDGLLKKLENFELLNDSKFAMWWVEQRNNFRPKPVRVLKLELRNKGLDKNIIDDVFENTQVDEAKIAKDLLQKNQYKWNKYDTQIAKRKRIEYLGRKGFSWDVIKKAIEN